MHFGFLLTITAIFNCLILSYADDYKTGRDCPKVDPVPDFDLKKFSGLWYVIQKFDESTPCWTYYFVYDNTSNMIIQSRNELVNQQYPERTPGNIGRLEIPNATEPGSLIVSFSDNIIGKQKLTVYFTDYDNYGAIFQCQPFLFGRRQSATILSRMPYLSSSFLNRARAKLVSFNIDIKSFKSIDQSNCIYTPKISTGTLLNLTNVDV